MHRKTLAHARRDSGRHDFHASKEEAIGHHDAAVKCVDYSHATGQLITGGWDRTLRCWDPRSTQPALLLLRQAERVYSLSLVAHHLVVAMAGRHVAIYDLRNMAAPEQVRESSLKFQTRCVRCFPNSTGGQLVLLCVSAALLPCRWSVYQPAYVLSPALM